MNIRANELRISNVIDFEGRNAIVKEIDSVGVKVVFDDGEEIWIDLFQFQPIPLTEDWLIKFGKIEWLSKDIDGFFYWFNGEKKYLKFVHSLQNTYFYIEQKELL